MKKLTHTFHAYYPDETECPECGTVMELSEDSIGWTYTCRDYDCGMPVYAAEELYPHTTQPPKASKAPKKDAYVVYAARILLGRINRPATAEDDPAWQYLNKLDRSALKALAEE